MSDAPIPSSARRKRVVIIGPVYPYRAGIAYCTTRLAEEMARECEVEIVSFKRQYPRTWYPGGQDVDPTLLDRVPPSARFVLDILRPASWWREGSRIARERPDAVIFVWWIWVWAVPYLLIRSRIPRSTRVILQCHNAAHKEPAKWKDWLTSAVFRRADALVVHAETERQEAINRLGSARGDVELLRLDLPVHELGRGRVPRKDARAALGLESPRIVLFFGHIRPFKGLDLALRAWPEVPSDVLLLVAGEAWWDLERDYRELADDLGVSSRVHFDFRFIPDDEIATFFGAADLVIAPYRSEAQSGVILTAFHFGRPVVATSVGGIPEIVCQGVNGLLVEPESPRALAQAVRRFFEDYEPLALERVAEATARKLSWDHYAKQIEKLI